MAIVMFSVGIAFLAAQPLATFQIQGMEAYNQTGNWVLDVDSGTLGNPLFTNDGNPLTWGVTSPHFYAEKKIRTVPATVITCIQENLDWIVNPAVLGIEFAEFSLIGYERINTVNPANPWNTPGEAGDRRIYLAPTGVVKENGMPKLYVNNIVFVITTPYPTQAQMRLRPGFATWVGNIGTGAAQTGYGFCEIDTDLSDAQYAALFAGSGFMANLPLTNILTIPTATGGTFTFGMQVLPAGTGQSVASVSFATGDIPLTEALPEANTTVEIISGNAGNNPNPTFDINVIKVFSPPSGGLPAGQNFAYPNYWKVGSTLSQFSINITFNIPDWAPSKAPSDWTVLYREGDWAPWQIWGNFTLIDAQNIVANNVNLPGEFTISSPLDETLPVELSSFAAYVNAENLAEIKWATASETEMMGFLLYYDLSPDPSSASCITPVLIPAHNSSQGASYSFVASDIYDPGTYYFWLEAISFGNSSQMFGPISLAIDNPQGEIVYPVRSVLQNAYPNPFTGSTRIDVEIKEADSGSVSIYDMKGRFIRSHALGVGYHSIIWDGKDSKGDLCANGVYFYRLNTNTSTQVKKVILMR